MLLPLTRHEGGEPTAFQYLCFKAHEDIPNSSTAQHVLMRRENSCGTSDTGFLNMGKRECRGEIWFYIYRDGIHAQILNQKGALLILATCLFAMHSLSN